MHQLGSCVQVRPEQGPELLGGFHCQLFLAVSARLSFHSSRTGTAALTQQKAHDKMRPSSHSDPGPLANSHRDLGHQLTCSGLHFLHYLIKRAGEGGFSSNLTSPDLRGWIKNPSPTLVLILATKTIGLGWSHSREENGGQGAVKMTEDKWFIYLSQLSSTKCFLCNWQSVTLAFHILRYGQFFLFVSQDQWKLKSIPTTDRDSR